MRIISCFLVLLFFTRCTSYQALHRNAIVIDTHNDALSSSSMKGLDLGSDLSGKTHSDITRFLQGGMDIQVFSIFCDERFGKDTAFKYANREIDSLYAVAGRNSHRAMIVKTVGDLQQAVRQKKLGCMMGVEGGHMIEDRMQYLDSFYKRGVRYMTLTWNNSTPWATSAMDETTKGDSLPRKGLTEFGKNLVRRMNALGMIVDISHVGEQTFWDAINTTTKPVIASHSCVYSLCPVFRNLKDDQIKAIGKNGGVIHLNFYSGFVDSSYTRRVRDFNSKHRAEVDSLRKLRWPNYEIEEWMAKQYPVEAANLRPPLSMLLDHLDYIVRLIGTDHVGLGSDFDGISSSPSPLDDVTSFPLITKALRDRGYSKKDVKKILGENFIRVFRANQAKQPL
jgi:membrane dipeptidase